MKWFLRFFLWTAALVYPSYVLAGPYQSLLIRSVALILGYQIHPPLGAAPDLAASNMLGVYAAMCLASTRAPRQTRALALVGGLAVMFAIECATGLAAVGADMAQATHGGWPPWAEKSLEAALAAPRFGSAPLLWLILLGPSELHRDEWRRIHRGPRRARV